MDVYCAEADFPGRWRDVLERRIASEEASVDEIACLNRISREDIGTNDLGLIVAALRLGNGSGQPAMVVTDDIALSQQILKLKHDHQTVILADVQYRTDFLGVFLSLEALRELHLSCGLDNEFWHFVLLSFKQHHNGRQEAAAREHDKQALAFLERYSADRAEKQRRDDTREIAREMGIEDG
ncbi:MAG: hypothetical protein WBL70_03895 [Candidatus Acidiferrales bacterium]